MTPAKIMLIFVYARILGSDSDIVEVFFSSNLENKFQNDVQEEKSTENPLQFSVFQNAVLEAQFKKGWYHADEKQREALATLLSLTKAQITEWYHQHTQKLVTPVAPADNTENTSEDSSFSWSYSSDKSSDDLSIISSSDRQEQSLSEKPESSSSDQFKTDKCTTYISKSKVNAATFSSLQLDVLKNKLEEGEYITEAECVYLEREYCMDTAQILSWFQCQRDLKRKKEMQEDPEFLVHKPKDSSKRQQNSQSSTPTSCEELKINASKNPIHSDSVGNVDSCSSTGNRFTSMQHFVLKTRFDKCNVINPRDAENLGLTIGLTEKQITNYFYLKRIQKSSAITEAGQSTSGVRYRHSTWQYSVLRERFNKSNHIDVKEAENLGLAIGLSVQQIQNYFKQKQINIKTTTAKEPNKTVRKSQGHRHSAWQHSMLTARFNKCSYINTVEAEILGHTIGLTVKQIQQYFFRKRELTKTTMDMQNASKSFSNESFNSNMVSYPQANRKIQEMSLIQQTFLKRQFEISQELSDARAGNLSTKINQLRRPLGYNRIILKQHIIKYFDKMRKEVNEMSNNNQVTFNSLQEHGKVSKKTVEINPNKYEYKKEGRKFFSKEQQEILRQSFLANSYPTRSEKLKIAQAIDATFAQIHSWFSNRRSLNDVWTIGKYTLRKRKRCDTLLSSDDKSETNLETIDDKSTFNATPAGHSIKPNEQSSQQTQSTKICVERNETVTNKFNTATSTKASDITINVEVNFEKINDKSMIKAPTIFKNETAETKVTKPAVEDNFHLYKSIPKVNRLEDKGKHLRLIFDKTPYPSSKTRMTLATNLDMPLEEIDSWFETERENGKSEQVEEEQSTVASKRKSDGITKEQLQELEEHYEEYPNPNSVRIERLAKGIGLSYEQTKRWFYQRQKQDLMEADFTRVN